MILLRLFSVLQRVMKMAENTMIKVYAPMSGQVIPVTEVPDAMFSEKMLGDGAAILPSDGKIVSPVEGTLVNVAETGHAFMFITPEGAEILLHVGLETVSLEGVPFNVMAEEGAEVQPGTVLAEVNLEYLREKGIETVSPTVVCGGPEYRLRFEKITEAAAGKQLLYTIEHV